MRKVLLILTVLTTLTGCLTKTNLSSEKPKEKLNIKLVKHEMRKDLVFSEKAVNSLFRK